MYLQKKKEKTIKRKSSLKIAKMTNASYPTIPEADENNAKRSDSRQTQISATSLKSGKGSVRSIDLSRRPSTSTSGLKPGSKSETKKDLRKEIINSKERLSKSAASSTSSIKQSISRKGSAGSRRSSIGSEKGRPRRSSSSVTSKGKIDAQDSRSSARARSTSTSDVLSVSTVSTAEREGVSLGSLIDLYNANPERRSTIESLEEYSKAIFKTKQDKKGAKKSFSRQESGIQFSDRHSDTDESSIVIRKGGDDETLSNTDQQSDLIQGTPKIRSQEQSKEGITNSEYTALQSELLKHSSKSKDRRRSSSANRRSSSKSRKSPRSSVSVGGERKHGERRRSSSNKRRLSEKLQTKPKNKAKRDSHNCQVADTTATPTDRKSKERSSSLGILKMKPKRSSSKSKSRLSSSKPIVDRGTNIITKDNETLSYLTKKRIISFSTPKSSSIIESKAQLSTRKGSADKDTELMKTDT